MEHRPSFAARMLAAGLLLAFLLMVVPTGLSAIQKQSQDDPQVSDGRRTLLSADLSSSNLQRLSALRDHTIIASYGGDNNEVLTCPAKLKYTLTGVNPSTTSASIDLACTDNLPASGGHIYQGTLTVANMAAAGFNAVVTFMIEVPYQNPAAATHTDNNGGAFYKYRLDKTEGELINKVPAPVSGASVPDHVTTSVKPAISFSAVDDEREAALNVSTIRFEVDQIDRTAAFDCISVTVHRRDCTFNYAKAPPNFQFSEGRHVIQAFGRDEVQNDFSPAKAAYAFRVDNTAPAVSDITAVPNQGVLNVNPPITARGVNVTVKATVTDPNMNNNSVTAVFAQLFNATINPPSALYPLKFVAASSKWEAENVTIPLSWPEQEFQVKARVFAVDMAGNAGVGVSATEQFVLDPVPPTIAEKIVAAAFILDEPAKVGIEAKDGGSGIDTTRVRIRFSNVTGTWKAAIPTSGFTKLGPNTWEAKMKAGSGANWTFDIPAAKDGATISYFTYAVDKAGGNRTGPTHLYSVDTRGPIVSEPGHAAFRGKPPLAFTMQAVDTGGVGVNASKVTLHYRSGTSGAFSTAPMLSAPGNQYTASVTTAFPHGTKVEYYYEAFDLLGNRGNFTSELAPLNTTIDLEAPVFTLKAPANATTATFKVEWNATDAGSDVDTFTIQARVADPGATPTPWVTVRNATTAKDLDFCAAGNHTYQFRGFATDKVGNVGSLPNDAMATTRLTGAGCQESVTVDVLIPTNLVLEGATTVKTYEVAYDANPGLSFTPKSDLRIDVFFSPDDGAHFFEQARGLVNSGTFTLKIGELPDCRLCIVKVRATTQTNVSADGSSVPFTIRGGDATVDLDENGLPDSWETNYGTRLGQFDASKDDDGDGLSNAAESSAGTSPTNEDTDGDGFSDALEVKAGRNPLSPASVPTKEEARTAEYTSWYWSVPALFAAVAAVFFVGLARRW